MIKNHLIGIIIMLSISQVLRASSHTIPFRLVNNLIIFQATVGERTGNFILDTGTSEMVLNSAYFEGQVDPIDGGTFQSIHGKIQSRQGDRFQLKLDGLSITRYAIVIDLRPIEKQKRLNILGLVGGQIFKKYEIMIDYFSEQIILYGLDKKGMRRRQEPLPIPAQTLAFKYKGHIPYISTWIDDTELRMGLDTGVEVNVFSLQILEIIKGKINKFHTKTVIGLNGKTSRAPSALVGNLEFGILSPPAMETIFMSLGSLNKLSGPDLDGLLGQEFLKHFRIAINFKKKEIYLWNQEATMQGPLVINNN